MNTTRASLYNTNDSSIRKAKVGFLIATMALLTACGGGSGTTESGADNSQSNIVEENSELANQVETLVEGAAIKGAIENGIVNAYLIQERNGLLVPADAPIGSSVRTDANGNYSLRLEEDLNDAVLLVEITADDLTTMKCDVTTGCGLDLNGELVEFGDRFSLNSSFSLKSIATNINGGDEVSVSVSPLTHMAVAKLDGMTSGYSESNVTTVFADVENLFGLESGALSVTPADITRIEAYASLSSTELEMGVISASILALVNSSEQETVEDVLDDLESAFRNDGSLSAQSANENDISVESVLQSANDIAGDLVQVLPDSNHSEELDTVATSIAASYQEVAGEVIALPVITQHPQSISIDEGASISLSVVASGESIAYQWRKDGVAISGSTTSSFVVSESAANDAGEYDVLITNSAGSVVSLSAVVAVNAVETDNGNNNSGDNGSGDNGGNDTTPGDGNDGSSGGDLLIDLVTIVSSPSSVEVKEGESTSLSVAVTGQGTIGYQWRKDEVLLVGETANSLTLSGVGAADAGQYDVLVTNEAGTVTSSKALVSVDVIELATIVSSPQGLEVKEGESALLSVSASGKGSITYQWRKDGVSIQGETSTALTISNAAAQDAGQYDVLVTNEAGTVTSSMALLEVDVIGLVEIVSAPQGTTVKEGETAQLSVTVSGEGDIGYQWRKDGVVLQGDTSATLVISDASEGDAGQYYVQVTNEAGTVTSSVAVVEVDVIELVTIDTSPQGLTVNQGEEAHLSVAISGEGSIAYQWRKDGVVLQGETSNSLIISNASDNDEGHYDVQVTNEAGTVTSSTASVNVLELVTILSAPQGLTVKEGQEGQLSVSVSGEGSISYQWRKGGVAIEGETSSSLVISGATSEDAGQYDVQVTNEAGTLTSSIATVEIDLIELVQITSSPSSVVLTEGGSHQFSFSVSGEGSITYQWRKDGVAINGATSSSLDLSSVQSSDAGSYDVVVTNEAGDVTSGAAELTVNPATHNVTLNWYAPQKRVDGVDIEMYEISGYKIVYGLSENELTSQINVSDGTQSTYLLEGLESGTYYFSIATIDSDGVESDYTAVIELSL